MENRLVLQALASDLKRVAIGLNRGSTMMAKRFEIEAIARIDEVELDTLAPYVMKMLKNLKRALAQINAMRKAEDLLMYSTLIQNYTETRM